MDREKLQRMLTAVQQTKAADYVGTQEAWNYLKAVDRINNRPQRVADSTNKRVQDVPITYPATPERITGLFLALHDAHTEGLLAVHRCPIPLFKMDGEKMEHKLFDIPSLDYVSEGIAILFGRGSGYEDRIVDYSSIFFLQANREQVVDDLLFGALVATIFREEYENIHESLAEDRCEPAKTYFDEFSMRLIVADWARLMSREAFTKYLVKNMRDADVRELRLENITDRIQKEKLENRYEYRRLALSRLLSDEDWMARCEQPVRYESLIAYFDQRLQKAETELPNIIASLRSAPTVLHEMLEDRVHETRMDIRLFYCIKEMLLAERTWVERALKS